MKQSSLPSSEKYNQESDKIISCLRVALDNLKINYVITLVHAFKIQDPRSKTDHLVFNY